MDMAHRYPHSGDKFKRWDSEEISYAIDVSLSRMLSAGLDNQSVARAVSQSNKRPPHTLRDLIILQAAQRTQRGKPESLQAFSKRLLTMGVSTEARDMADFFASVANLINRERAELRDKLAFLLRQPLDRIVTYSEGDGAAFPLAPVLCRDADGGESRLCLGCRDWACDGSRCGASLPVSPPREADESLPRHNSSTLLSSSPFKVSTVKAPSICAQTVLETDSKLVNRQSKTPSSSLQSILNINGSKPSSVSVQTALDFSATL